MRNRMLGTHAALYGNVAIQRQYCKDCLGWSLVLRGKFACCRQPSSARPKRYKRMSSPEVVRFLPPKWQRDEQMEKQQNLCFYCELAFGNYVTRDGKPIKLRVEWDHFVPWIYSQNNYMTNFVAACHVCNRIKSDTCFGSVDEAKSYIASKRAAKGYL